MAGTVYVRGLDRLVRDFRKLESTLPKEVRSELNEAGKIVAADARSRFSSIQPRSAASMRHRMRGPARVVAEQRRGTVTGQRPDFGRLQMARAFLPALDAKASEVERRVERMLDRLSNDNGF